MTLLVSRGRANFLELFSGYAPDNHALQFGCLKQQICLSDIKLTMHTVGEMHRLVNNAQHFGGDTNLSYLGFI